MKSSLILVIYLLVLVNILPGFFLQYPIPEFIPKLKSLMVAMFVVLSSFSIGKLFVTFVINKFKNSQLKSGPLYWVIYMGMGLGLLGSLILLLGWAFPGSLKIKLHLLTFVLCLVLVKEGILLFWHRSITPFNLPFFSIQDIFWILLASSGMAVSFLSCFSPVTYYDSLVYHLALPALYSGEDTISAVPFNMYSYFPQLIEMLFLFVIKHLSFPDYTINLLGWVFSLGIGLELARWSSEMGGRSQGLIAFALWWSMPTVLLLSVGGYVDIPLAFFIFLSIRTFVHAKTFGWEEGWLLISGLLAGFACSTKLTGAICPFLLFLFLIEQFLFERALQGRKIFLFCGAVVMPMVPWLIKNGISVGNPFFPFFYSWLGGEIGWTKETATSYFRLLTEYGIKGNVFVELLFSPWRMASSSARYGGGFDVLGLFGWHIYIYAVPLFYFVVKKYPHGKLLWFYFMGHFLIWVFTKPVLRFFVAALPIAGLLTSSVILFLFSRGRPSKFLSTAYLTLFLLSNFFLYFFIQNELQPFSVSLGIESRQDYLRRRLTYYPTYEFVNNILQPGEKILLHGEQRTYHLKVPYLASNLFAPSLLSFWFNKSNSDQLFRQHFEKENIHYILINRAELNRLGGPKSFGFSEIGSMTFESFLKRNFECIHSHQNVEVFKLKPQA